MGDKEKISVTKKSITICDRVFSVDPARLALASSDVNADMLLHTPRARIHDSIINKKDAFYKESLLLTSDFNS